MSENEKRIEVEFNHSASVEGSCNSCHSNRGMITLIRIGSMTFRLCVNCRYELMRRLKGW